VKAALEPYYFHNGVKATANANAADTAIGTHPQQVWFTNSFFGANKNGYPDLVAKYGDRDAEGIYVCSQNYSPTVTDDYLNTPGSAWPGVDDHDCILLNLEPYRDLLLYPQEHIDHIAAKSREICNTVKTKYPNKQIGSYLHFGRDVNDVLDMADADTLKNEDKQAWADHLEAVEGAADFIGFSGYIRPHFLNDDVPRWKTAYQRLVDFYVAVIELADKPVCGYTSPNVSGYRASSTLYKWTMEELQSKCDSVCVLLVDPAASQTADTTTQVTAYVDDALDVLEVTP